MEKIVAVQLTVPPGEDILVLFTAQDADSSVLVRQAIDELAAKGDVPAETLLMAPEGESVAFAVPPPVRDAAVLFRTIFRAIEQKGNLRVVVAAMGDEAYEVCKATAIQMRIAVQQSDAGESPLT